MLGRSNEATVERQSSWPFLTYLLPRSLMKNGTVGTVDRCHW